MASVNAWAALGVSEEASEPVADGVDAAERRLEEVEALAAIFGEENVRDDGRADGLGVVRVTL